MNMAKTPIEVITSIKNDKRWAFIGRQGSRESGISLYCRVLEREKIIRQVFHFHDDRQYHSNFLAVEVVDKDYGYMGYGSIDVGDGDLFWIARRAIILGIRGVLQRGLYGKTVTGSDDVELLSEESGGCVKCLDIYPEKRIPIIYENSTSYISFELSKHFVPVIRG